MANNEDLSKQLEIMSKLSASVEKMAKAFERSNAATQSQIGNAEKLRNAINNVDISGLESDVNSLNQSKLDDLKNEFSSSEQAAQGLGERLKDLAADLERKFPASAAIAVSGVSGFYQGLRNLLALGKGVLGFVGGLAESLFSVGAAILTIPLKILTGLIDFAAQASAGGTELAEALEALRKEFGALYGPTNKTIIDMSQSLKGFSDTGLSTWRVFGNLAKRLNDFRELAVAMGATFQRLLGEFADNGGALLAYQKGLGISNEEMKAFAANAISRGEKISSVLKDTAKYALEMGHAFGMDSKIISKDMSKALADVKHFAGATTRQIGEAAVYARKLGLELDKITGTLDQFETYDSAAESVAKLSQAFGVQVDAFELMNAQDPATQVDMLKKAFRGAGVDASNFSRQQLKLLSQTTGLDEATAKLAFSMHNQGMGLDEVKKRGAEAEKKTLTQAEAMKRLADSIERLVQSGGSQTGGFWDMFIKGFLGGIQASKEFRTIIMNIKRALQQTYMEGVRLGRAFVELFPGIKEFFGGIADFFEPAKFKNLVGGVVNIVIDFFKKLSTGQWSFPELMKNIREKFLDFFDKEMPAGKKMLDGFKTVVRTMSKILAEGIKWMADKIAEGIKFVVEFIRDPEKALLGAKSGAGGALGFLGEILLPIADALKHAWDVLAPAAIELFTIVAQKIWAFLKSDKFINIIKPAIPWVAATLFGPAFTRAIMGAVVTGLGKAAVSMFTSGGGKKVIQEAAGAATKAAEAAQKIAAKSPDTKGIEITGDVNKAAGQAIKGGDKWGVQDAVKLGLKLVAIAAALSLGGLMVAGALVGMKKILSSGGIKTLDDIITPLALLTGVALAAVPLTFAMKLVSNVGISKVLAGGLIISAAVGVVGLVGAGLAALMKEVGSPSELKAAGDIMLKMSLVFMSMVPLIFGAMAIGALASGPQAVVLAAAGVGLAAIGVAVGEMAKLSVDIVKEIAKIKVDASFMPKIDAFLGVMKAIQAFTDSLVAVINAMTPSFTEIISGTAESFTDKVDSATKLINEMIGQKGGKSGIIGIVETALGAIEKLNVSDGVVQSAQVFSSVIEAISGLMKSVTPPDAFYEAGDSFLQRLSGGKPFADLATDVNYYVTMMEDGLFRMLKGKDGSSGILGLINTLASVEIPNAESTQHIVNLVGAVAGVLKTLTPDSETIKAFKDVDKVKVAGGLYEETSEKLNTSGLTTTLETLGTQLNAVLDTLTGTVITNVISKAGELTKEKLEGVKVIGDIFKVLISLIDAFGSAFSGQNVNIGDIGENAAVEVTAMIPSFSNILEDLGKSLGPLMDSLTSVVKSVPTDAKFMKNLETATKVFGFVSELPKLAKGIADASKASGGQGKIEAQGLITAVQSVNDFLFQISSASGTEAPLLMTLMDNIKKIGSLGLDQGGDKIAKTADRLAQIFSSVNKAATSFTAMSTSVTTATSKISADGIAPAVKAVEQMVKTVNDLDAALSNGELNKVDIQAKLGKVAKSVGLGGSATKYTVTNKGVAITVNLQVNMQVDEVEKVLVLRKQSIIRDRINMLSDKTNNTEGNLPSSPNSPVILVAGTAGSE